MPDSYTTPPRTLEGPLEVAPGDWAQGDFYLMMTSLVIPRPIGWISTVSASGVRNLAPYSYFNLMGSDPFYLAFGSSGVKDTLTNLREVPQFVANIVTMHLIERMNMTSGNFPRDEDEYGWAGLTPAPSAKIEPPRVGEAKAHLECEVVQIVSDRNTHIVIGRIVHAHVDPSVWKDGRIDPRLLDPEGEAGLLYGAWGMPATYLIDRKGVVQARLWGPAEWNSPQARKLIAAMVEQK
jgi:flavin reductase (DIM6/NTAB) family NADH-FMN oxidoreductase RutF